jgi:hypothetical protein
MIQKRVNNHGMHLLKGRKKLTEGRKGNEEGKGSAVGPKDFITVARSWI